MYLRSRHLCPVAVCCAIVLPLVPDPAQAGLIPLSGADGRWAACIRDPDPTLAEVAARRRAGEEFPARITSDQVNYTGATTTYDLEGNVVIERADQRLQADQVHYNDTSRRAEADGNVRYRESGLKLSGSRGDFFLGQDRGKIHDARYTYYPAHAHGDAQRIKIINQNVSKFYSASYSTCPPGHEDWDLQVSEFRMDQATNTGEVWNARLHVLGVPVMYLPYLNFPISDKRKSGFLAPLFAASGRSGTELTVPYYWNIAPNYDATIAPHYMSNRGLQLQTEFRYLQPTFNGMLQADYLPNDKLAGKDRWSYHFIHGGRTDSGLSYGIDAQRVSDDQYLNDFGDRLSTVSTSHLASEATAAYGGTNWSMRALAETWQTVNPDIAPVHQPYRLLPAVYFSQQYILGGSGLAYNLNSQLIHFDHKEPDLVVTGTRMDLKPTISYPMRELGYFVEPAVALRYTTYRLNRPNSDLRDDPSRTLPIFSLDSGLYLERDLNWFGKNLVQTLEPRLYYLYVPYRDQSELPLFDTGRSTESFAQYFSDNRFSGPDRVGDANQVTAGVTSRFMNAASGREYLRLQMAQIFYFQDRKVALTSPTEEDTRHRSDIIGEATLELPFNLTAGADVRWDPYVRSIQQSGFDLQYHPAIDTAVNFSVRRQTREGNPSLASDEEQTELSFVLPVGGKVHLMGGWRYSLVEHATLERFTGLEYRNCCWAVRLVDRAYLANQTGTTITQDDDYNYSFMFEVEFRGLSNVGDAVNEFLRTSIPGYTGIQ